MCFSGSFLRKPSRKASFEFTCIGGILYIDGLLYRLAKLIDKVTISNDGEITENRLMDAVFAEKNGRTANEEGTERGFREEIHFR